MRTVDVKDTYEITGRGTAYVTVEPDPPWSVNEHVIVNGKGSVIIGIETYALANGLGKRPGMNCALLVRPMVVDTVKES